jgi:cytochrome c
MLKRVSLTAVLGLILSVGAGWAQDVEAGEKVFKKCKACHQIGPDAQNKVGPELNNLIGRNAGASEGFEYGASMLQAGEKGLVWSDETVAAYLEDPTKYLRAYLDDSKARSGMSFKLNKEQDRLDVVAFLGTSGTEAAAQPAQTEAVDAVAETRTIDEIVDDQVFDAAYLDDPANIAAGKEIWFAQCTHCHGYKAYPGKAPKLKPAKYKPPFVFKRVYKGFKKMPAWNEVYSVEEVRQIVAYVKSQGFAP